jgi:hypothetical protein
VAGLAALSLIPVLTLYLIGFLNRIFPGENAKNRAFCGGEKLKAAAVYHAAINQGAGPCKSAFDLRCLNLLPCLFPALLAGQCPNCRNRVQQTGW